MISWAVVGHEQRLLEATTLAKTLGAVLTLDDGTLGAGGNHTKAWELTTALDSTWAAVLEDDAQPVPGFLTQAEQALSAAPEPVVSFYLGQSRPKRWQTERIAPALANIGRTDPHWIVSTHVLHAVAVAIHADIRDDWIDFANTSTLPPDERLSAWCIAEDHRVAYSWPSLVDHADGASLVNHKGQPTGPRIAWRTGTRTTWTPAATRM